jgi:hypothetical protein
MRASRVAAFRATPLALAAAGSGVSGLTFPTGASFSDNVESVNFLPSNERGVKSSTIFPEPNTAVYDSTFVPWTYFDPIKVDIEKLPVPEKKYYQRLTRKPWDVTCTEWMEISARKRYVIGMYYLALIFFIMFLMPKERSFSGLTGSDGFFVNLPKGKDHYFA